MSEEITGSGLGVNIEAMVSFKTDPKTIEAKTTQAIEHGLDGALNELQSKYKDIDAAFRAIDSFVQNVGKGQTGKTVRKSSDLAELSKLTASFSQTIGGMSSTKPTQMLSGINPSADLLAKMMTTLQQGAGSIKPNQRIQLEDGTRLKFSDLQTQANKVVTDINNQVNGIANQLQAQTQSIPIRPQTRFDNRYISNQHKLPARSGMVFDIETANLKGSRSDIWGMAMHSPQGGLQSVQRDLVKDAVQLDEFNRKFVKGLSETGGTSLGGVLQSFHSNYKKAAEPFGGLDSMALPPLVGHNIRGADLPWLNNAIRDFSEGVKPGSQDDLMVQDLRKIVSRAPVVDTMDLFADFMQKDMGFAGHKKGFSGRGNTLENITAALGIPYTGHDAMADTAATADIFNLLSSPAGREIAAKKFNKKAWQESTTQTAIQGSLRKALEQQGDFNLFPDVVDQMKTGQVEFGFQDMVKAAQFDGTSLANKYFKEIRPTGSKITKGDTEARLDSIVSLHGKAASEIKGEFSTKLLDFRKSDSVVPIPEAVDNILNSPGMQDLIGDVVNTYGLDRAGRDEAFQALQANLREAAVLATGKHIPKTTAEAVTGIASKITADKPIPGRADRISDFNQIIDGAFRETASQRANLAEMIPAGSVVEPGSIRSTQLSNLVKGTLSFDELKDQFKHGGVMPAIPEAAAMRGNVFEEKAIKYIQENLSDQFTLLKGQQELKLGPTTGHPDAWGVDKASGNAFLGEFKYRGKKDLDNMLETGKIPKEWEYQTNLYAMQAGLGAGIPVKYFAGDLSALDTPEMVDVNRKLSKPGLDGDTRLALEKTRDKLLNSAIQNMEVSDLHVFEGKTDPAIMKEISATVKSLTGKDISKLKGKLPQEVTDFYKLELDAPDGTTQLALRQRIASDAARTSSEMTSRPLKHGALVQKELGIDSQDPPSAPPPDGPGKPGGPDGPGEPPQDRNILASSEQTLDWLRKRYDKAVKRFTELNELEKGFGEQIRRVRDIPVDERTKAQKESRDFYSTERETAKLGAQKAAREAHALKTQIGYTEQRVDQTPLDLTSPEFLAQQAFQTQQARISKAQTQAIQGAVGIGLDGFDLTTFHKAMGPALQLQKLGGAPAGFSPAALFQRASEEGLFVKPPKDMPSLFDGLQTGMSVDKLIGKEETVKQDLTYFKSAEASVEKLFGALQKSTGQTFLTPAAEEAQKFIKASEEALAIADQLKSKADIEQQFSDQFAKEGDTDSAAMYAIDAQQTRTEIKQYQDEALKNAQIAQARVKQMEPDLTSQDTQGRIFQEGLIDKEQKNLQQLASVRAQKSFYQDPKNHDSINAALSKEIMLQKEALQLEQARLNVLVQRDGATLKDFQNLHGVNTALRRDHGITTGGIDNQKLIEKGRDKGYSGLDIAGEAAGAKKDFISSTIGLIDWQLQWMAGMAVLGTASSFIKNSFGFAVEYEAILKGIQLITQANVEDMRLLEAEVAKLATTFHYSASQLGEALTILGKAGFAAVESLKILPSLTALATATMSTLKIAADVTTTAVEAYHLPTEDVPALANTLAAMTVESKLDLEKLGTTFNYVAASASSAGISIEETGTAMGLMANAGIRASTIGTSLRSIMGSLMAPTAKFQTELAKVGMSVDEVNPLTNRLSDILLKLQQRGFDVESAFSGLDKRIAGGVNTLVHTAHLWEDFESSITGTNRAFEMAEGHMDTLEAQTKRLANAFQFLGKSLMGNNLEELKTAANLATNLTRVLTKVADAVPSEIKGGLTTVLGLTALASVVSGVASGGGGRIKSIKSKRDAGGAKWADDLTGQDKMIYTTAMTLFNPAMIKWAAAAALVLGTLSVAYEVVTGKAKAATAVSYAAKLETEHTALTESARVFEKAAVGTGMYLTARKELEKLGVVDFSIEGIERAISELGMLKQAMAELAAEAKIRSDQNWWSRRFDSFKNSTDLDMELKARAATVQQGLITSNLFYGDEQGMSRYMGDQGVGQDERALVYSARATALQSPTAGKAILAERERAFNVGLQRTMVGDGRVSVIDSKIEQAKETIKPGVPSLKDAVLNRLTFGLHSELPYMLKLKSRFEELGFLEDTKQRLELDTPDLFKLTESLIEAEALYGDDKTRTGAQLKADQEVLDAGKSIEALQRAITLIDEDEKIPEAAKDKAIEKLNERVDAATKILVTKVRTRAKRSGFAALGPELMPLVDGLIPLITSEREGELGLDQQGLDLLGSVPVAALTELTDRLTKLASDKDIELSKIPEIFKTEELVAKIELKYELQAKEVAQSMIDKAAAEAGKFFKKLVESINSEAQTVISDLEAGTTLSTALIDAEIAALGSDARLKGGKYGGYFSQGPGVGQTALQPFVSGVDEHKLETQKFALELDNRNAKRVQAEETFRLRQKQLADQYAMESARLVSDNAAPEVKLTLERDYYAAVNRLENERQSQIIKNIGEEGAARVALINRIAALDQKRASVSKQFAEVVKDGQKRLNPKRYEKTAFQRAQLGGQALFDSERFMRAGDQGAADEARNKGLDYLRSVIQDDKASDSDVRRAVQTAQSYQVTTDMQFSSMRMDMEASLVPVVDVLKEIKELLTPIDTQKRDETADKVKKFLAGEDATYQDAYGIESSAPLSKTGDIDPDSIGRTLEDNLHNSLQRIVNSVGENMDLFTRAVQQGAEEIGKALKTFNELDAADKEKKGKAEGDKTEGDKTESKTPEVTYKLDVTVTGTDNLVAVTAKSAAKIVEEELTNGLRG